MTKQSSTPTTEKIFRVDSLIELEALTSSLIDLLPRKNIRVFLSGELGAGKTAFSKLYLSSQGYTDRVLSPSFGVVISYDLADCTVHHFDCYRLHNATELLDLDLDLYLNEQSCLLVEWPENGMNQLVSPDIHLYFSAIEEHPNSRKIRMLIYSPDLQKSLANL